MLALDDQSLTMLVDTRSVKPRIADNVWVRVLDVAAALSGRRYQSEVDVVVEVEDPMIRANTGRWHLSAPPYAPAVVTRTERPAALQIDMRALGAAYLGGTSLIELAGIGWVKELQAGTLAPAATAFGWPVAPACPVGF